MNKNISVSESKKQKAEKQKSFLDRLDFYLRLVLSKKLVNQFWRLYYSRLRRFFLLAPGAAILALCMQKQAVAQLFDAVETGPLEDFLPDDLDLDFFPSFFEFALWGAGLAVCTALAFQLARGGNADLWVSLIFGLVIVLIGAILWTGAIYGT